MMSVAAAGRLHILLRRSEAARRQMETAIAEGADREARLLAEQRLWHEERAILIGRIERAHDDRPALPLRLAGTGTPPPPR